MLFTTKTFSSQLDDLKRRVIKVLRFGNSDVQTALESMPFGLDAPPIKDMVAIYGETSVKGQVVIIGYLNKNQKAEPGEFRMYSTDANGAEKFYVWLKKDGIVEIGGDTNFAVKYNELKEELDKLQEDHNNFLIEYKAHVHTVVVTPTGLVASPTVSAQSPNTSDFAQAKNEKIKTIG